MAFWSEENLSCPVCHEIFQEPVILLCSHSFCKACIQRWWTENPSLECPVCKRRSLHSDPPLNLALKNLCEAFLQNRTKTLSTGTEGLCSLHNENLKLFCLDDQQPLCVICLHSEIHRNHSIRPIDEAAQDYREILRELLKCLREKWDLLNDVKLNFDQTAQDIEVQAQDTERQIKDTFLMLQKLLKEEEQERSDAVKKEKKQKIQMMRSRSEALSRDTDALSDTVGATEEVLRAADLSFLQNYKTAAEIAQYSLVDVPQPIGEGLIDVTKHLNNLSVSILDSMKGKVTSNLNPQTAAPERLTQRQSCFDTKVSKTSQSTVRLIPPLWRRVEGNPFAFSDEPNYSPNYSPNIHFKMTAVACSRYSVFMEPHRERESKEKRKNKKK